MKNEKLETLFTENQKAPSDKAYAIGLLMMGIKILNEIAETLKEIKPGPEPVSDQEVKK